MPANLTQQAIQAVELAQGAGAKDAWVTTSQSRDVEFEYRDGALEKVKTAHWRKSKTQRQGLWLYKFMPTVAIRATRRPT